MTFKYKNSVGVQTLLTFWDLHSHVKYGDSCDKLESHTTDAHFVDLIIKFAQAILKYIYIICYVPGVTRKELGNQNLVFEKSAKSTFKI